MASGPCFCVVLPAYNHPLTAGRVLRAASEFCPVIAVDDGSTDATREALANGPAHACLRFESNRGKAAALVAGMNRAKEEGFSHAITIDADGQHDTKALPSFAAAARANPYAFIVGQRDLCADRAPVARRLANALSSACFRFETGVSLSDTLCGYRVYPLQHVARLNARAPGYAFELEILVHAVWSGLPVLGIPIIADYTSSCARVSHFRLVSDVATAVRMHVRLFAEARKRRIESQRKLRNTTIHA